MTGHRFLLSEHALSNAIDLASFHLANGDVTEVERHWSGGGVEAAFLREAARAAGLPQFVVPVPMLVQAEISHPSARATALFRAPVGGTPASCGA
jgi:hypothetical protein